MRFDYVIVGGGLQGSLLLLALLAGRPGASIALVEREASLGGNHTWCFHARDIPEALASVVEPLVVARWSSYDVLFPELRRTVQSAYAAVTSERLHAVVSARVAASSDVTRVRGDVVGLDAEHVWLRDGRHLSGKLIIDARGPGRTTAPSPCGYQKFVGLELDLAQDSAVERPIVFDATVPQTDGFRFVYVLPFSPRRVLVEDTYYSDHASLDGELLKTRALDYAAQLGLKIRTIVREERGVLPIPLERMPATSDQPPLAAGYAGGFFHPTTGYSFPLAAKVALHVATRPPEDAFDLAWEELSLHHARESRFAMMLNRWLFRAVSESDRFGILSRFYSLPEATIERFYALDTTSLDRARIVCGKPPRGISWRAAFAEISV